MKELKDYINFYIGCPCIFYMADDDPAGYRTTIDYDTIKRWLSNEDETDIKPTLRRLEDMTEEDLNEMITKLSLIDLVNCEFEYDQYWVNAVRNGVVVDCLSIEINGQIDMMHHTHATNPQAEAFHYLLSKGFDLFGLIPAGLAVDAKTITP